MSYLKNINACESGQEWADSQSDYRAAWDACERGDWMLWIASKQNVDRRNLTGAKAECAGLVEHLMKDQRSVNALRVAERFAKGEVTGNELRAAATAAYAAATAAYAAADAAADAAYAADADAYAAAAAAYAAAAYAAAAYAAVRSETRKKSADIVRRWISFDELKIEVRNDNAKNHRIFE